MLRTDEFDHILEQLAKANSFVAVFGRLPTGSHEQQRQALRRQFGALAKLIHPDVVAEVDKAKAGIAFRQLNQLRIEADQAITAGTYDQPFPNGRPSTNGHAQSTVLQSSINTYHLEPTPRWRGDFSVLYPARAISTNQAVIIKIAATPPDNARLEFEANLLSRFNGRTVRNELVKLGPFLPNLIDTFMVAADGGRQFRANVMVEKPGLVSVTDIRRAFPNGLDPRDAAWVFRRTLAHTIAARMAGVVHGAIVPDHILVEPIKHEPLHIGWTTAVELGRPLTTIINRWREFYPPEVFRKSPADHRTDLYMAGQTMVYLLGGNTQRKSLPKSLPEPVAKIIRRCLDDDPARRPTDGRVVLDDFTNAIAAAWGRTYRPLHLTVR